MLKPKIGDMVRLKPLVVYTTYDGEYQCVKLQAGRIDDLGETWIKADLIEEILPRPLAVGDRVRVDSRARVDSPPTYARLRAIHNGYGWIEWTSGSLCTYPLDVLRLVDDAP